MVTDAEAAIFGASIGGDEPTPDELFVLRLLADRERLLAFVERIPECHQDICTCMEYGEARKLLKEVGRK